MLVIVVLSKLVSTLQFAVYLPQTRGVFIHLVGLAVDGSLFVTVDTATSACGGAARRDQRSVAQLG